MIPLILSQRHFVYEEAKKLCGLKIVNSVANDSGTYTLVIDNQFGKDECTSQVIVNSKYDQILGNKILKKKKIKIPCLLM